MGGACSRNINPSLILLPHPTTSSSCPPPETDTPHSQKQNEEKRPLMSTTFDSTQPSDSTASPDSTQPAHSPPSSDSPPMPDNGDSPDKAQRERRGSTGSSTLKSPNKLTKRRTRGIETNQEWTESLSRDTTQSGAPHTHSSGSSGSSDSVTRAVPFSTSQLQFTSRIRFGDLRLTYRIEDRVLGSGFNGPVRVAVHRQTGKKFAIKTFHIKGVPAAKIHLMRNEALIYLKLDHPNVVRLIELWEDSEQATLVMELCTGGELYDRLSQMKLYTERSARDVTRQMLLAVHYLHSHGVVHRDLKLENWLYETQEHDAPIRLIDFGFSRFWSAGEARRMRATCGTLAYVSPDTLRGGYTNACDMWSLGVIVFMLLVGYPPFHGPDHEMAENIMHGKFSLKGQRWMRVSSSARDFVARLMVVDPEKRMTALEALKHPWFNVATIEHQPISQDVLTGMRQYAQSSNLKRAALTMMAYSLTSEEIQGMHEVFLSMDETKEGTIRVGELAAAVQKHHEISNEEVQRIFASMDSSGDQQVYYTDFLAAMLLTRLKLHEHLLRSAFDKFDTDNTGYISLENLQEVLGSNHEAQALQHTLMEADKNHNGKIEYNEFLDAILGGNSLPSWSRQLGAKSPGAKKPSPKRRAFRGPDEPEEESEVNQVNEVSEVADLLEEACNVELTGVMGELNSVQRQNVGLLGIMVLNSLLDKSTQAERTPQAMMHRKTPLSPSTQSPTTPGQLTRALKANQMS